MKQINFLKSFLFSAVMIVFGLQQSNAQTNIAPLAVASASTCNTGPCSTLNDLNLGTCGSQSMWISTSTPPSLTPGVDWIQWDWTSTKTFDEMVIHHAQNNARFLTGFTIQYWNGTAWVTTETISNLPMQCINNVKFNSPVTAARWRITSFQMTGSGQISNPNFREIEIIEAILGANNAAVAGLDSPTTFCAGTQNIVARIANRGINQLNSVIVNWRYNGITQTPISFVGLLDTNGGSGPTDTAIFLGTRSFAAGVKNDLEVWTSMPNGVVDTITQDDSLITELQPSLSGTFTIDPAGSGTTNYLSFADAAADLAAFGVCGPVTMNVATGVYNEQVDIGNIAGASAINTITFQEDPNNSGPVLMSFSASTANSYIVNLNGANYVTFDGIDMTNNGSYGTTVRLESGASNNTIRNAVLTGSTLGTTSTLYANVYASGGGFENNSFINDSILGGSINIYYYSGSSAILNPGIKIEGNYLENAYYMAMYIYGHTGGSISNNTVISQASYTSGRALYSYYGGEGLQVNSNLVINNNTYDWPYYGLMVYYNTGSDTNRCRIANNMIHLGTQFSSGYKYGIYNYGNIYTDVLYNNVGIETSQSSSRALYQYVNGIGNRTYNNNFLMYNQGYAVYTTSTYAPEFDYNNLASNSSGFAYFNSTNSDLASFITAGGGANSISVDSIYTNLDSMRTCDTALFAKGTPIADYAVDFDGDFRNPVTPNIGADEYVASAELFTIGDTIEFCGGSELVLGTTMNDATFLWSTSETTPTITVTKKGNYSVIVDGPCATGMSDDVEVIDVNPVASFSISSGVFLRGFTNNSEYGISYHWDFGDGSTSTQENPFHEYTSNGMYTVILTVMNECDTITSSQNVSITVGVNEFSFDNNLSIYPNPANDFINIAVGNVEDQSVQMELVDMKGQVYANRLIKVTGGTTEQIDVSSLSKGVYLVRLTTSNEVATRQIVVQ